MSGFTGSTNKEDVSIKLKAMNDYKNLRNAKQTTTKLGSETKQMELRLQELKLAMGREKEQREREGGGFWKSGKEGALSSHAKDVLNAKVVRSPDKPRDKKTRKIKVLKDEPIVKPERSKQPGTMGHIAQQSVPSKDNKPKGPKCGQCEQRGAAVSCVECGEDYCAMCFASFHLKGALRKHRSMPLRVTPKIQSTLPMPRLATPSNVNESVDLQPYMNNQHGRNRDSPIGASQSYDSQLGGGATSEDGAMGGAMSGGGALLGGGVYDEQAAQMEFQAALADWRAGKQPVNQQEQEKQPESTSVKPFDGPSLLDGTYDEAAAASSFKDAVKQWRKGEDADDGKTTGSVVTKNTNNTARGVTPVKTPTVQFDEGTSTQDSQNSQGIDVTFHSTTSYAEKLMLKRHRRTDLPSPRSLEGSTSPQSSIYVKEPSDLEEFQLDAGDHLNFGELIAVVRPPSNMSQRSNEYKPSSPSITEVQNIVGGLEETMSYQVEDPDFGVIQTTSAGKHIPNKKDETRPSSHKSETPKSKLFTKTDQSLKNNNPQNSKAKDSKQLTKNEQNSKLTNEVNNKAKDAKPGQIKDTTKAVPHPVKGRVEESNKSVEESSKVRANSRSGSRAKSASKSARPKSTRPGSRAKSRAYSRVEMFGEGILTKAPSEHLKIVAGLSSYVDKVKYDNGLNELFKIGVSPGQQEERVMIPTADKNKKKDEKISYKLYQMSPKSWRPDSSLGENVTDNNISDILDSVAMATRMMTPVDQVQNDEIRSASTISFSLGGAETGKASLGGKQDTFIAPSKDSTNQVKRDDGPSTKRPKSSQGEQRPDSRAIVVDGDDLTSYDGMKEADEGSEKADEDETLHQLQWELTSETGHNETGKTSRLSVLELEGDSGEELTEDELRGRLTALSCHGDDGIDISNQLREEELMGDFEEMEALIMEVEDQDDVKQLQ